MGFGVRSTFELQQRLQKVTAFIGVYAIFCQNSLPETGWPIRVLRDIL